MCYEFVFVVLVPYKKVGMATQEVLDKCMIIPFRSLITLCVVLGGHGNTTQRKQFNIAWIFS